MARSVFEDKEESTIDIDAVSLAILGGFILVLLGKHLISVNPTINVQLDNLTVDAKLPSLNLDEIGAKVKGYFE